MVLPRLPAWGSAGSLSPPTDGTGYPSTEGEQKMGSGSFRREAVRKWARALSAGRGGINAEAIAVVRAGGTEGVFAGRQIPDG